MRGSLIRTKDIAHAAQRVNQRHHETRIHFFAQAGDEDPLFGDIDQEQALSLNSSEGSRIGFVRNLG